jgi:hypothetical protein
MSIFNQPQSKGYARITGLFYLIIAVVGFFSILYVPSVVKVAGDPAATMLAIAENRSLFNLGIAGEVVIVLAELFATTMLYFMFKPVSATLSLAAAFARFAMAIVMAVMLFFTAIALQLGSSAAFLDVFSGEQRQALAYLALETHDFGVVIWQVFFTAHLLLLGYLVLRSGAFPKLLGILMVVGSLGYLFDSAHKFMFPMSDMLGMVTGVLLVIVSVGEIGFALWLLIKGPKTSVFAS